MDQQNPGEMGAGIDLVNNSPARGDIDDLPKDSFRLVEDEECSSLHKSNSPSTTTSAYYNEPTRCQDTTCENTKPEFLGSAHVYLDPLAYLLNIDPFNVPVLDNRGREIANLDVKLSVVSVGDKLYKLIMQEEESKQAADDLQWCALDFNASNLKEKTAKFSLEIGQLQCLNTHMRAELEIRYSFDPANLSTNGPNSRVETVAETAIPDPTFSTVNRSFEHRNHFTARLNKDLQLWLASQAIEFQLWSREVRKPKDQKANAIQKSNLRNQVRNLEFENNKLVKQLQALKERGNVMAKGSTACILQ